MERAVKADTANEARRRECSNRRHYAAEADGKDDTSDDSADVCGRRKYQIPVSVLPDFVIERKIDGDGF